MAVRCKAQSCKELIFTHCYSKLVHQACIANSKMCYREIKSGKRIWKCTSTIIIYVCVCVRACVHACVHACVCVCVYVCVYLCLCLWGVYQTSGTETRPRKLELMHVHSKHEMTTLSVYTQQRCCLTILIFIS